MITRKNCPICGNQGECIRSLSNTHPFLVQIFNKRRYSDKITHNFHYVLDYCMPCNFIWQRYILDDQEHSQLYTDLNSIKLEGEWIEAKIERDTEKRNSNYRELQYLRKLYPFNDMRILDYGCGWGGFLSVAKSIGLEAEGVDISASRVGYCLKKGFKVFKSISETHGEYDVINLNQVLEHLQSPNESIGKIVGKLKRGGYLRLWPCQHYQVSDI